MLQYKMILTKPNLCFTLTLALYTMFVTAEAPDAEALRVLSVGVRGQSSVSIADLLSGNKEQKQKDGEIVKTPVMTDEGRRLTLVTGPNLCEEDTARQSFTTALFLSSPGPHAVLMLLDLEDPKAEPPCDLLQQAQELLGAEVLQYCIVILQQNQQELLTGASRGIAGDMINACGGRFHIIPDVQTKPAALLEEIDKLVQLNNHKFLSVLTDFKPSQYANGKNDLLSVIYDTLGGAVGIGGLVFCISLTIFVAYAEAEIQMLNDVAKMCGLVLFMFYLRHFLRPDVAILLNLALLASLVNVYTKECNLTENEKLESSGKSSFRKILRNFIVCIINELICLYDEMISFALLLTSALVFGSIISIRTWSDVLFACYAAPGVTIGAFAFKFQPDEIDSQLSVYVYALGSFLCCSFSATLSVGFLNVLFAQLGVKLTIILAISLLIMPYFRLDKQALTLTYLIVIMLVFPSICVLTGSVFLIS